MHITRSQLKRIRHLLPKPRGSRLISHFRFFHALAYMASNGCKWRALPAHFGPWHTVYKPRYRQRNEVERLFRRIKAYRRVFTRYDKLDLIFAAFVSIALICEQLRYVNTP